MNSTVLALNDVLPRHPRTGLRAVGWSRRGPVWPILGGAEDDSDDGQEDDDSDDGDEDDGAENEEEDESKIDWKVRAGDAAKDVERWKTLSRKHEKRAKDNAKAVRELADLKRKGMSTDEQAVSTAREEARAEERTRLGGRLVEAEIRGRIGERLEEEQIDSLVDGVNAARFLDDDGDVDTEAVREWVDKIAPKTKGGKNRTENGAKGGAGMGQGRGDRKSVTGVAAGRARYAERIAARGK